MVRGAVGAAQIGWRRPGSECGDSHCHRVGWQWGRGSSHRGTAVPREAKKERENTQTVKNKEQERSPPTGKDPELISRPWAGYSEQCSGFQTAIFPY